ncbi:MAG: GNAT family N-acetyltransferase [Candidatus Eremiobacteraeota bacterium]|nr:GNAT family N-acetyltransferase [Candidatus Eremiobacteraeota bacterium]
MHHRTTRGGLLPPGDPPLQQNLPTMKMLARVPWRLRSARPDDADALEPLFEQLGYPLEAGEIRRRLERVDSHRAVLVATYDDTPIGFIGVALCEYFVTGARAEVQGLVVLDSWRGRGVGSALLDAAERWARDGGASRMHLTSNTIRERAHGFYQQRAYEIVKTQRVFEKTL